MEIPNLHLPFPPLSSPQNIPFSQQAQLPHQVKHPNIKPLFLKTVTWAPQRSLMPSFINKFRYKGLSSIRLLCAGRYENIPNDHLRVIHKSLKETKRLLSLTISHSQVGALNLELLPHFLNATSRLKKLTVSFDHFTYGEDFPVKKDFEKMLIRFKRFRDLSNLYLTFDTPNEITNAIQIRLFKQLKGLTKLEKLRLDLVGYGDGDESLKEDSEPNALIFTFKYPRSLRSLYITFQRSNLPHFEMIPIFASNLSRCHSLEHLSLDCDLLSPKFNLLAPIFQMTNSLKALCVSRNFSLQREVRESRNFATSLEHLKYLTELGLWISMDFPEGPTKKFVKILFTHLSSLINLESLNLFNAKKISKVKLELYINGLPSDDDLDFQDILLNLKSLSRLQTLDLSLHDHADSTMTYLQSLFQAFQSLTCLRNFRLNLPREHKISRQNIIALSLMLKNLDCLKNLNLTFNDPEVGSDSLEILFASIAHFQLTSLLLDVRQKGPLYLVSSKKTLGKDATAIKLLFSAISNFTSLSSLDLNLTNLDFPDTDLKELSLSLTNLKQLRHLSLKFGPQGQGPRIISPSLKKIPKLTSLQLICSGELSNDTVQLLASSLIACHKNLKSLDLEFRLNNKSGNTPLEVLEKGLGSLVWLKNLTIKLKRMNMFKCKEVVKRLEVLKFLKNLERIVINLPFDCRSKEIDELREGMKDHWNLKTFIVNSETIV